MSTQHVAAIAAPAKSSEMHPDERRPVTGSWRVRLGFAVAGVAFIAYPVLRPAVPEEGLTGAAGFASNAWVIAHTLGMLGFIALAFTARAAVHTGALRWTGRPLRELESRTWLAAVLLLPYYGAEAFGLHTAGRYALNAGLPDASMAVAAFRFDAIPVTMFGAGLLLLMLVGARLIVGLWRNGTVMRVGGLLAGLGLVAYLPQFFLPMPLRIVHGIILGAGLLLIALRGRADAERG